MAKSIETEVEIKPDLRVPIDRLWFTVTVPLNKKCTKWQLVGNRIPVQPGVSMGKIVIERTSEQIRELIADNFAKHALAGGRERLPRKCDEKPKKKPLPPKNIFIEKLLAARRNRPAGAFAT